MNILWKTCGLIKTLHGKPYSDLASTRYRLIAPALGLGSFGVVSNIISLNNESSAADIPDLRDYDIVVVSKVESEIDRVLIEKARSSGVITILDICDNHFSDDIQGKWFTRLALEFDMIVASTPKMAEVIKTYTDRDAFVVSDAVEGSRKWPVFQPGGILKLLWYGHKSNVKALTDFVPELIPLSKLIPLELNIVTSGLENIEQDIENWKQKIGDNFNVKYSPWSIDRMSLYFDECDMVIIPSAFDERSAVKSPNRLSESLWAGKYVVAHPILSYDEFASYTWVGNNLIDGIQWGLNNSDEVPMRLHEGQNYIEQHYTINSVVERWRKAFNSARASRLIDEAQKLNVPIRLNLGCGDKILDHYINIDVAETRAGVCPDIIADLKDLPFIRDDSVDEILSVHVIEHFWRWEVNAVLAEWARILKPGGKLILECPNLQTACEEFLKNPQISSGEGQEGQRTMWVFYGDPKWKDPLMVHRWGYTPSSLAKIVIEAGFTNVSQKPAQFKLREPRDMRLEALK